MVLMMQNPETNSKKKEEKNMSKRVLDACCGSRMFWFNPNNPDAEYVDNRTLEDTLCDGRHLSVNPDVVADFRHLPFE